MNMKDLSLNGKWEIINPENMSEGDLKELKIGASDKNDKSKFYPHEVKLLYGTWKVEARTFLTVLVEGTMTKTYEIVRNEHDTILLHDMVTMKPLIYKRIAEN